MQSTIESPPENLITKCGFCEYCIFEYILRKEQRDVKVLDMEIPQEHVHRLTIEQICGKEFDGVCLMKYAAMRAFCDDRKAMQMGAVKNFAWDLGKINKKEITLKEAMDEWGKDQDLGRGKIESYAERYGEVWQKGLRTIKTNGTTNQKQTLTVDYIYGVVVATPETYEKAIKHLDTLNDEHDDRDNT